MGLCIHARQNVMHGAGFAVPHRRAAYGPSATPGSQVYGPAIRRCAWFCSARPVHIAVVTASWSRWRHVHSLACPFVSFFFLGQCKGLRVPGVAYGPPGGSLAHCDCDGARPDYRGRSCCLLSLGGSSKVGIKRGIGGGFWSGVMHVGVASR